MDLKDALDTTQMNYDPQLRRAAESLFADLYSHSSGITNPSLGAADLLRKDTRRIHSIDSGLQNLISLTRNGAKNMEVRRKANKLLKDTVAEVEDRMYEAAKTIQLTHRHKVNTGQDARETAKALKSYKDTLLSFKKQYSYLTSFDQSEEQFLKQDLNVKPPRSDDHIATKSPVTSSSTFSYTFGSN